jgi:hypothetical protein
LKQQNNIFLKIKRNKANGKNKFEFLSAPKKNQCEKKTKENNWKISCNTYEIGF